MADDNQELLAYLSQTLIDEDFQVVTAADGEQAFTVCKTHLPDLIVSDVVMPNASGLELVRWIRNDEDLQHLPIILLTSDADKTNQIDGIENGADNYLT